MDHLKRRHVPSTTHHSLDDRYHQVLSHEDEDLCYDHHRHKLHKPSRTYTKFIGLYLDYEQYIVTSVLTLLSCWTRFRIIDLSNRVVWDEAHFGKFGSYYLKHEFYFDVHPPLGKMLVGLSGWLAGYDGSFEFESGSEYPEDLNFALMRIFSAAWGAMIVPIAYLTAKQFGMSTLASILAATMVLCDTAYLCISRFILLDSMLIFFTCTTLYCLSCFHNTRNRPFSRSWWTWLALTGASLGCVLSVKWVGLFAVALVGLYTLEDLWNMFGDLSMKKTTYVGHWIARSICLIFIPAAIYMLSFAAHFHILSKSGPGDANMSSLFQAHLEGNKLSESPIDVAYNSTVTIKNHAFGGGLLHSHIQTYPEGSKQQQVTTYNFKDANNLWSIQHAHDQGDVKEGDPIQFIKDGDVVRLVHVLTRQNLHSHMVEAPITSSQFEVSGHGAKTGASLGDDWRVEIIDKHHENLKSLMTRFRLRHVELGCLLAADNVRLPQWGFRQVEVTCDKDNRVNDHHTWWNIEEHTNEHLPPPPKNAYKSNFFKDFKTLNNAMWLSNNALIPDPDKDDILTSSPWQWPLTTVGLRMCSWGDTSVKFYLLGNPSVWWPSFASLIAFLLLCAVYDIRARRQLYSCMSLEHRQEFVFVGKTLFLGWFLHYIPFFIMGRVTYLHHYFPALYFSILMAPFLLDHFTVSASLPTRTMVFTLVFALVIANFIFFSPFAYGMVGPVKDYSNRRWLQSWNLIDSL